MGSILRSPAISDQRRKLSSKPQLTPSSPVQLPAAPPVPPATPVNPAPDLEMLMAQVRTEARAALQKEADTIREQARQQGLNEGRQAAAEELRRNTAAAVTELQAVAQNLAAGLQAGLRELEPLAVAIAYEAAGKMLGEVAHLQDGIQGLVRQALAQVVSAESVTVRLGRRDLATLRDAGVLEAEFATGSALLWQADDSIAGGGCIIETGGGDLDARLETQFERLRQALLKARN